jgi:hypothetical protein
MTGRTEAFILVVAICAMIAVPIVVESFFLKPRPHLFSVTGEGPDPEAAWNREAERVWREGQK